MTTELSPYTVRWKLHDMETDEIASLLVNPNAMDTPTTPRTMQFGFGRSGMAGIDLHSGAPADWTFTGVLLFQAQYDMLVEWTKRDSVVRVSDHLGRTFETIIQKMEFTEKRPTPRHPWRGEYTLSCLLLGEIT